MAQENDAKVAIAVGAVLLLWYWWNMKNAAPQSSLSTRSSCCDSSQTAPYQPMTQATSSKVLRSSNGVKVTTSPAFSLTPPAVPGSNGSASGSGSNWNGLMVSTGTLVGPAAPLSPTSPTSTAIKVANTRVVAVGS